MTLATLPYTTRYATPFIYHALFAALAWALLAPLSHLVASVSPTTRFSIHRATMLAALALTGVCYTLGSLNAAETPLQHALLANALVCLVCLQFIAGLLRPHPSHMPWRRIWARAHRALGFCVLAFSFFFVAHSLSVFQVDGWLYVTIVAMLVVGAVAAAVTLVSGLVNTLKKGGGDVDDRPLMDAVDGV